MERWRGRVALVTGGSMGIGEATAKKLAAHGMKVVVCARSFDKLEALSKENANIHPIRCDLRDKSDIYRMFQEIRDKFGGVDVCVNSAGLSLDSPIIDGDPDQWDHMWEVNVKALCLCTQESVKSMRARNVDDGHIININSVSGHRVGRQHFYSATKYAVTSLSEGLRWELSEINSRIRVTLKIREDGILRLNLVKWMMERWRGRVALVTGGSMGIGEATAKRLVSHGMKVVVCARSFEKLEALSKEYQNIHPIKCDLRDRDDITRMFKEIKETHGGIDVCVNNAGLALESPILDGDPDLWDEMWKVNVRALCLCTQESVKSMRERNVDDGHIININSLSGHRCGKQHFYSATKFAVTSLSEGLRWELNAVQSRIRVTSISPGLVHTNFAHTLMGKDAA
ncbi:hypothetical protein FSP39_002839 [Pinctada imbricata]|uniref:Dehydrogenase/reductase SDR family member 11 n=1 Tax=Pinctada imbricata TaxID=66713 RepID=A0AA88XVF6_PINIB|nr:hypothetical protein FSP39_002839 [Pinctada imbricata]